MKIIEKIRQFFQQEHYHCEKCGININGKKIRHYKNKKYCWECHICVILSLAEF